MDGVTWGTYVTGLESRLVDYIAGFTGALSPATVEESIFRSTMGGNVHWGLGVAALEDKIVQQAFVVTILNQIYEGDFRGFSYGFRPGRSQHQVLDALSVESRERKCRIDFEAKRNRGPI